MGDTKACKACAEEIRATAKICPHCRQNQWLLYSRSPLVVGPLYLALFLGTVYGLLTMLPNTARLEPEAGFQEHAGEIVIRESSYAFGDCGACKNALQLTTVGMLENEGELGWKTLHFEVRYFDASGALIDSVSSKEYSMVLLPGGETSFRVKAAAARPREDYASHQVILKHAERLGRWP